MKAIITTQGTPLTASVIENICDWDKLSSCNKLDEFSCEIEFNGARSEVEELCASSQLCIFDEEMQGA